MAGGFNQLLLCRSAVQLSCLSLPLLSEHQLAHSSFPQRIPALLPDATTKYGVSFFFFFLFLRSADIKVKEPSLEAMARGKIVYKPPNFMTVNTALEQLLEVEQQRQEQGKAQWSLPLTAAT